MGEGFKERVNEESRDRSAKFDQEAEKKYRQEVREILSTGLSETLRDLGFKKVGNSLWSRAVGEFQQF